MPSAFSRLYDYAGQRENFTTEALAAAIRDDPEPMLACLGAASARPRARFVEVLTQARITPEIQPDLILVFEGQSDVWVEVKVDAPESGDQLQKYINHLRAHVPQGRLVTLARVPLLGDGVVALRWQSLRREIPEGCPSPLWRDFRQYLEEIRMADSYDEALIPAERQALSAAGTVLHKIARILVPVAEEATSLAPRLDWPLGEREVLRDVSAQLRTHGTINIFTRARLRAGVSVGARPTKGEPVLSIWVWNHPKATAVRRRILEHANGGEAKLPDTWRRSLPGWEGLSVTNDLRDFEDHSAASGWLQARLRELTPVLRLLPDLGSAQAEDEEAVPQG